MSAKAFICGVKSQYLSAVEHEFLLRMQPYGVILFARNCDNPTQVKTLCAEIMNCLKHPFASILIDQEGGRVARLKPPNWRKYPPAAHFKTIEAVKLNARVIAEELLNLCITTNCAPLADLPVKYAHDIIGDRAFGSTAEQVTRFARAQAEGLMEAGIMPILKHIPGHGRARTDSHEELPVVDVSLETLEATDFVPFRALRDIPLGMTAHIIYTAIDAKLVATQSKKVIDYIREVIGFDGLLMSDDLSMKALAGTYAKRTKATFAAGCDLALHCNGDMAQMHEVASESPELVGESLRRALKAKAMMPLARAFSVAEFEHWAKSVA